MKKYLIILSISIIFLSCSPKKEILLEEKEQPTVEETIPVLPEPQDLSVILRFPNFTSPLKTYSITSSFGEREQIVKGIGGDDGDLHKGVDLVTVKNAQVLAVADGYVYIHYPPPGAKARNGVFKGHPIYGALIIIDHGNGIFTLYGHMKTTWVRTGQKIKQGDSIGIVGSTGISTGPHLHFEIIFDPMVLLEKSKELTKDK